MCIRDRYINKVATTKKIAGGIRIQSISNNDENNYLVNKTVFKYDDANVSTGRLMSRIQNFYNETDLVRASSNQNANNPCCFIGSIINPPPFRNYIITWANSVVPMGNSTNRNIVGYDKVTVNTENGSGENQGYSTFYYSNFIEEPYGIFLPGIPNKVHLENGQLSKEEHFKSNGNIVKKKWYNYYQAQTTLLDGLQTLIPSNPYNNIPPEDLCIIVRYYDTDSEWWYLKSDSTYTYSSDGSGTYYKQFNTYNFDSQIHKLVSKVTTIESDGSIIESLIRYPSDINTGNYLAMSNINMLNYPIEKLTTKNSKVIEGLSLIHI